MQFIQKKNRRQLRQHVFNKKTNGNNPVVENVVKEKTIVTKKEKKTPVKVEKPIENNVIEENL